jgi:type I restriction enzyme S subunit
MSFSRYPNYKPSGVEWLGDVPEHWEVKRIRFVAELNPSKSEISALDRETTVSFLPMEAIGEDGTLSLEKEKSWSVPLKNWTGNKLDLEPHFRHLIGKGRTP